MGTVTLVCRGGRRSGRAECMLREQGHGDVAALKGGWSIQVEHLLEDPE
jgi:rhodanese-related sulfurtransferase